MLISTQKQMICQLVYPDHRDEYFAGLLSSRNFQLSLQHVCLKIWHNAKSKEFKVCTLRGLDFLGLPFQVVFMNSKGWGRNGENRKVLLR